MISHGSANFLREKLFIDSDNYTMNVCGKCGLASIKKNIGLECKSCKTSRHIKEVAIPYASKLLFQELMAMQIVPRLNVSEIKEFN